MAFSYNPALQSNKDRVRFLLQDTTNTTARPAQLDDGEILWALSTEANIYMAAALCADTLASRARGVTSKKVGGLSLTYGTEEMWTALSKKLRSRGQTHAIPTAGGITKADRDDMWENTDLLRPSFFSELHEDPAGPVAVRAANWSEEEGV